MSTDIPHPDRLGPGDLVGPWRIVEVLGAGGLGRVFKVESEGKVYALKMAVRPPGQKLPGEEDVDGWSMREATAMLGRAPHPNIPRVFQVGRWPDPESGFLFVVMEFIDGWRFNDWRYEKHPTAAQLVDVLLPLVRTLADLHKAGIQHRDLNAQNLLIRKEDGSPVLLDFGSVSLPGARTLTQGIPPVALSVVPPEALEHARLNGDDARFRGGPSADLYALGVLMYQALADGYPFNPELPPERLLAAITLLMPRSPHRVNPKVPLSLSRITLRLLAKRPEDRFESAEELHRALWEASKDRASRTWRVPLDLPESGPAPMTDEEMQERRLEEEKARHAAQPREQDGDAAPAGKDPTDVPGNTPADTDGRTSEGEAQRTKSRWSWERVRRPLLVAAITGALVAVLVALAGWWGMSRPDALASVEPQASTQPVQAGPGGKVAGTQDPPEARTAAASPEADPNPVTIAAHAMFSEESASVTTPTHVQSKQPATAIRAVRRTVGVAITCSALLGCPGAQVRPAPPAEECPPGALETMAQWGIKPGYDHTATFFTERENARVISVREGPTTVYLRGGLFEKMPAWELSGRLIFADRVYGRITEARMDGRTFPVCFELEDRIEMVRGLARRPNGSADTAKVWSTVTLRTVTRFE